MSPQRTPEERKQPAEAVRAGCTRFVSGHYPRKPQQVLADLAASTPPDLDADIYGSGSLIADFEAEVAGLFGKEAGLFFPSGTMAQQIALRIWAERSGNPNVAFHPTCHLEVHEEGGYRLLHGLHGELVGDRFRLMTLDDLKAVRIPLGALLIELPQRHLGGMLPAWDDLVAMTGWAREQGMITHLDGARVWECGPFYGRGYAAIAALFDTVYVSFYKILGGIAGAMLLGPADVIKEARVWQRRHGGNLIQMYPFVLSAKRGLDEHLPRMGAYRDRAVAFAAAMGAVEGITILPDPPQTNMFHAFFRADPDARLDAAIDVAEAASVWPLRWGRPAQIPGWCFSEFTVGRAGLDVDPAEVGALFGEIMARVRG